MELIEIGNYCSDLDKNHSKKIQELNLFGWNLWKVYRNKIAGDLYAEFRVPQHRPFTSSWDIAKFILDRSNTDRTIVRVTSTAYTSFIDDQYTSNRISTIVKSLESKSVDTMLLGAQETSKSEKCSPSIDIDESLFINYAKLLKYVLIPLVCIPAYLHYSKLKTFTDLNFKAVLGCLCNYLSSFLVYFIFYKLNNVKRVLFLYSSYGNEGEIGALKYLNIEVDEYQHGHLYEEHYGYNFHGSLSSIKSRMLFPDKLYVYGDHWQQVLSKLNFFKSEELVVTGNPSFENIEKLDLNYGSKTVVLVCSHPNAGHLYRELLSNYLKKSKFSNDVHFIVKAHPRESTAEWEKYCESQDSVELSTLDTYFLFNSVDIQLTGSSTTLFEAKYFQVSNYILIHDMKIDESKNFDASLGQLIDMDFTDQFIVLDNEKNNKYFSDYCF